MSQLMQLELGNVKSATQGKDEPNSKLTACVGKFQFFSPKFFDSPNFCFIQKKLIIY